MPSTPPSDLPLRSRRLLSRLARLWHRPGLAHSLTIEPSPRLRRALARVIPARRLIRLALPVTHASDAALAEVLCHEAAHVVVHERHGRRVRPHGPQWAALVRTAGYVPRVRIDPAALGIDMPPPDPRPHAANRYVYEHRCPVCHAHRLSRRVVRQWRCAACIDAGLEGRLEVIRWQAAAADHPPKRRAAR